MPRDELPGFIGKLRNYEGDKRTALARDIQEQIRKVFGATVFRTVISKSVRLEESPAYRESIFTFAPDSSGAAENYSLCEEVIDRA